MTDDRIAALFDIDGTLVDSNYLHVEAWQHAFQTLGEDVEAWRVHRAIGQDSSLLISSLVGDREESWVERATELHGKNYTALAPRLRAFDRNSAPAADALRSRCGRRAGDVGVAR